MSGSSNAPTSTCGEPVRVDCQRQRGRQTVDVLGPAGPCSDDRFRLLAPAQEWTPKDHQGSIAGNTRRQSPERTTDRVPALGSEIHMHEEQTTLTRRPPYGHSRGGQQTVAVTILALQRHSEQRLHRYGE